MPQEIHTQQTIDSRASAQVQHTDFELADLPAAHYKGIKFIDRCPDQAVCGIKDTRSAGILITDTALLKYTGSKDRQGRPGINKQPYATTIGRSCINNKITSATIQRYADNVGRRATWLCVLPAYWCRIQLRQHHLYLCAYLGILRDQKQ